MVVLNPDATIARTIDLPSGATGSSVFCAPDGTAYELLDYSEAEGGRTTAWQVLALATASYTTTVMGTGPTGAGRSSSARTASATFWWAAARTRRALADGTAYFLNNEALTASVYALTPAGAQKVLDADRAPSKSGYGPTFTEDGTGYVTVGTTTDDTLVYSFSTTTAL